jgi:hypothetical protein
MLVFLDVLSLQQPGRRRQPLSWFLAGFSLKMSV